MPRKANKKSRASKPAKKETKRAKKKVAGRGKRHTNKQKSTLLTKYHGLRKSGSTAEKAAKKVGVSYITLLNWEKKPGKPKGKKATGKRAVRAALKKAVAVPKKRGRKPGIAKTGGLTLVTPTGFRIEGISTKELIRVSRGG
jgi:DNA-binding XRE family transcriptional regulator